MLATSAGSTGWSVPPRMGLTSSAPRPRTPLAGGCRRGLRGGLLRDQLGPAHGDLSAGQDESPVERRDDEGWPPLPPGPFRPRGLPRLPRACAVYALRYQAPATRAAPTGGACRFTSSASTADHPGLQGALRPARRCRRDHGTECPKLRGPTRAVSDLAQSAVTACRDRCRHQFAATRRLVDRKATGLDPHATLCGAGGGGLIWPSTFPTVSSRGEKARPTGGADRIAARQRDLTIVRRRQPPCLGPARLHAPPARWARGPLLHRQRLHVGLPARQRQVLQHTCPRQGQPLVQRPFNLL